MFNKQEGLPPEAMTDAQMHDRLGVLKGKIAWINKWVPRAAAAVIGIGVAIGLSGVLAMGVVSAPLVVMSVVVGSGALGLAASAGVRGGIENEVFLLSEENKDRIERARLAEALADEKTARLAQSTLDLRKEFNDAIEEMGQGLKKNMTVGRALKLKGASPGFTIEF